MQLNKTTLKTESKFPSVFPFLFLVSAKFAGFLTFSNTNTLSVLFTRDIFLIVYRHKILILQRLDCIWNMKIKCVHTNIKQENKLVFSLFIFCLQTKKDP